MRYEDMRLGGYIEELARCFQTPVSVRALLLDADVALENLPPFANDSPRDYWVIVSRQIALGAAIDGFVRILGAAARRFPGNTLFSAFHEHPSHRAGGLRVMFLAALPEGSGILRVDREFQDIQDQLLRGRLPRPAAVVSRFGVSAENLVESVLAASPNLLHYAGHAKQDGAMVVEDGAEQPQVVALDVLGNLLRVIQPRIRCVVLNACYSAEAARRLVADTDVVVGTAGAIEDRSARAFARGFYAGLAHRLSVGVATGLGRVQMELTGQPGADEVAAHCRKGVDPNSVFVT